MRKITLESLKSKIKEYGTGYYLFDADELKSNLVKIQSSLSSQSNNFKLAYSLKANYHSEALKVIAGEGGYFDCSSLFEVQKIVDQKISLQKVWINTPYLTHELLNFSVENEILIFVDHIEQLIQIAQIANKRQREIKIGLRINTGEFMESRFGLSINSASIIQIKSILDKSNLKLDALNIHYSGNYREPSDWLQRADFLIKVYQEYFTAYSINFLNIGGGIYSPMSLPLAQQFNTSPKSWDDYLTVLEEITRKLNHLNLGIAIEPGMALVANLFYFLAEVVAIKTIHNRNYAILNTSKIFLKPTNHQKQLSFQVFNQTQTQNIQSYKLVGITCMETDVLGDYLGALSLGDLILFENVGAYTLSYQPNFIFEQPNVITI